MVNLNNFDWKLYLYMNSDINFIKTKEDAYDHYQKYGKNENRIVYSIINDFDWNFYVNSYTDLKHIKSYEEALLHFNIHGKNENRLFYNNYNLNKYIEKKTNIYSYRGCLAFYDTWPDINNAEKECLIRFEYACKENNILYLLINNDGMIKNNNLYGININNIEKKYINAIISLHWDSPKNSDHYTINFLWNPIEFYDKNNIQKILDYDAYVSCYSPIMDKFIELYSDKKIIGYVNHSLCTPILNYDFTSFKCFYVGINWELCTNKATRYSRLLKLLDSNNLINIYGPKNFLGINIWEGYTSYSGEINFDGTSIIHEINKSGICLVLSSESHKNSQICSNRLFEGLAAGVPLICDNNPFIRKIFNNNVFYIDGIDEELSYHQIIDHINFIKNNIDIVKNKIEECRKIFLDKFLLSKQLNELFNNIPK
jgi:glycosyltransferase involved in cell wall biosynthesis